MVKKFITTPIYYVNDKPHIGHAYTTIGADVLARYWRMILGDEYVFLLTGTDEHASKIPAAASAQGVSPKEFCDRMSAEFRRAWDELDISYNRFIRTTDEDHIRTVKSILERLYKNGYIYKGVYEGLYCDGCENFLTKEELTADGLCPHHGKPPQEYKEENYFFRLSAFRRKLIELIESGGLQILPDSRRNEVLGKLRLGLEDISISRSRHDGWGVRLPFDVTQTAYVWVDALINYATGAGYDVSDGEFSRWWPADCHLMAKDILWFHSVIWPAILIGAGIEPPRMVFAHGFFTLNGAKMSKTRGNVISPDEIISRYGRDAARYLLVTLFPFGTDGDVSFEELDRRYNSELANNLGNLVNRSVAMAEKYFAMTLPERADPPDGAWLEMVFNNIKKWRRSIEDLSLDAAASAVKNIINDANKFIQGSAPWELFKKKDTERLAQVMENIFISINAASICLYPFMPVTSQRIWSATGREDMAIDTSSRRVAEIILNGDKDSRSLLKPRRIISKIPPLFPRLTK